MRKQAMDLLIGDTVLERQGRKVTRFKVTGIATAACSPYKSHVTVNGNTNWCYDNGEIVTTADEG